MAIPKICGTETEYGITVKNSRDADPISNSILLINNYEGGQMVKIIWDYKEESPFIDARGFTIDRKVDTPGSKDNTTINKILENGARLYVDHAHPEFSTPECLHPLDVVKYEKAGERILHQSLLHVNTILPNNQQMIIYKNNSDHKGNSYGYHENYLLDRNVPFDMVCQHLSTFLITRQIFTGAGKVGAENHTAPTHYQISQRADFFETEIGLDTMLKRPIINTRDEPHADREKYRRLHVITGDVNMSEFTSYLKIGATALLLSMIEDQALPVTFTLQHPVQAMHVVSHDLSCSTPLTLQDGQQLSALDIQREFFKYAEAYLRDHELHPAFQDILEKWDYVLTALASDYRQLNRELDWVIKENVIAHYEAKHQCGWDDPRIRMLDLQYHDIRPEKGLYYLLARQGQVVRLLDDHAIRAAITEPPTDTRAYFRGQCLKKYPANVFGVSWAAISFDIGDSTIKRILMPEPMKGSQIYVDELLEKSETVEELLTNMTN